MSSGWARLLRCVAGAPAGGGPGRRRGIAIPLVVGALLVFGIFAASLLYSSSQEYRLTQKLIYREHARIIAEAGLAKATALIYQNTFENRWHRQTKSKYGFTGTFSGAIADGDYEVRAEDVVNTLVPEMQGSDAVSTEKRVTGLTYNRIDLFARGTFGKQSVIVYQAVVLKPEEKVYSYTPAPVGYPDGRTGTRYSDIRMR